MVAFELSLLAFLLLRHRLRPRVGKVETYTVKDLEAQYLQLIGLRGLLRNSWLDNIVRRELDRKIDLINFGLAMLHIKQPPDSGPLSLIVFSLPM